MIARTKLLVLVPVLALLSLAPACRRERALDGPEVGAASLRPPVAKLVPQVLEQHGHERIDNYYWLRERDDPEVLAYLESENEYTAAMTAHTAALREQLVTELAGRIKQADESVPFRERDYFYYTRWEPGGEHPLWCRKRAGAEGSPSGAEQLVLDADALAEGHDYFELGEWDLGQSQQVLAYSTDTRGRRFYTIELRDLRSGEQLPDRITDTTGDLAFANDDRTIFYTRQDPETLRAFQVYRHTLGEDPAADVLVYEERDATFDVGLRKTKSRRFVLLESSQTLSDEVRMIAADQPSSAPVLIQARERGLEYSVEHLGESFYILTNLDAPNGRLMQAPVAEPGKAHWRELVAHRDDVLLEDVDLFSGHFVLTQRRRGLIELEVHPLEGGAPHRIDFGEPAYVAYPTSNWQVDTTTLRFAYASMTTPDSVFDYDMNTRQKQLRKRDEVLGGFDPANYVTERLEAPARDGTLVPISLVRRRDTPRDGTAPLLLYGYGSYGSSLDAEFDGDRLSLLDRGFVYAIAHVRGGEELGRDWYEGGKLLNKRNSFTDFIDCGEYLVRERYADSERLFAIGGSAGGLLVGAVVNMRPDLFKGVIAHVPFVDVVTTMLDPSIPLTTSEYDEWGNPEDPQYYEYMLSYSPYDNVEAKAYPALLVTTGLHDSQVQYWEPAKWVAKLRAYKTDDSLLLLKTDMSSGHGGKAGRLESLADTAFDYAFLLDLAGLAG